MKPKFNKKYEKEINEILEPIFEKKNNKNNDYLLEMLNQRYEETKYPGFKYAIGLLYEKSILYSNQEKKHYKYYDDAASKNYLPALIKIMELYLSHIYYETTMNGICIIPNDNYNNMKDDPYGEYLLAKYEMIRSIVMNDEHKYFKNGLILMTDSADKGNKDAQMFINQIRLVGDNYEIKL